ncbi:MAG: outer membrane beta-barrel protein, partial [Xanthomonadales bacterium]|nr:outer membrane beta-barrel protein [Xanthomonadales bacterium]
RVSPRFIPYLNLGYSYYDFLETGRKDRTYSAGAGLKYFVARNTYVVLGASHAYRNSNDKGLFLLSNDFRNTGVFLNFTALLYPLSNH